MKLFKVLTAPTLQYGSETISLDLNKIQSAEGKFQEVFDAAQCWVKLLDVRIELGTEQISNKVAAYRQNWTKWEDYRYPKTVVNYSSKERRNRR